MSKPSNRPSRENQRTPVGQRAILSAPEKEGFKRRFVNDENGRIEQFEAAGYKIVDEKTQMGDKNVGQASQVGSVARKPVGGGTDAVLMEIKEDFYNEDQEAKEARIMEAEQNVLKEGAENSGASRHTYGDGVKIGLNRQAGQIT